SKQDGELSQKLQAGEYCYVFNARQMGKSSLRVRVMKELRSQGCQCIPIDMTRLCDFSIEKQSWYEGFFREIFYGCELDNSINYQQWIISHQHLTNFQRFAQFIEEILFVNFPHPQIMRWRPPEQPDPNILIVEATAKDINKYGIGSDLSDEILAEVIAKLESHKPTIIGLDFWREKPLPSESGYKKLLKILSNNQKIVAVCSASGDHNNKPGTKPPEGVPEERLGFTDVVVDHGQFHVIRRHLISMGKEEKDPCQTSYSLSARVAFNYLESQGIKIQSTASENVKKVGDVVFQELGEREGFYQNFDAGGFQVLLNYRNSDKIGKYISVSDVLSGNFDDFLVRNKIVLIGSTDPNASDKFYTPYSYVEAVSQKQISGVVLHAHKVSQIISAVLDGRPLIRFCGWWADWLLIFFCSGVGGMIGFYFRRVLLFVLFIGGNIIILYSVSLYCFTQGFVLPLVPSILAFVISGFGVFFVNI
ncbi:MAG: CHASE2 domain-containing protein, partial [Okeania sp. SIO2D1]|nr:CHASE2 domain-containing protein [Okeania sp. SIO2D1]